MLPRSAFTECCCSSHPSGTAGLRLVCFADYPLLSQLLSETDWASRPISLCENSSLQACLHDLFSQSATVLPIRPELQVSDSSALQTIRCFRCSCLRLIGRPAQYHSVKTALCKQACTICFHRVLLFLTFNQSILLFRSRRICRLLPGSGSLQMPAPVLRGARRR